jgi:predicted dehydrogenase
MVPGQNAVTPMIYSIQLEYDAAAQVMSTLHFNNIIQVQESMGQGEWFVDGTEGSAVVGTDFMYCFKNDARHKHVVKLEGSWFPDAFGGSMGELMQALTEEREPLTSGRDNLNSIKIAYAAVESSRSGETVTIQ